MYVSKPRHGAAGGIAAAFGAWIAISAISVSGQSTVTRSQAPSAAVPESTAETDATRRSTPSIETQRALLDRYCVTCHNDRVKTANLSLQGLELAKVADHAELWERVIRKLRAGVMPPPGIRRPPLAEYEALRDFLENEIDRNALPHPGAVVMHWMNRAEYANAVRDLLGVEIDPALFLPPDDSASGFDNIANIAGSLTISPAVVERYLTAAARIARMAVGYWKSPTQANYIVPGDTSQTQHIEGLPFGTRGGVRVRHNFPGDGEYTLSVQNYSLGAFLPGEKIEFLIDGQRVRLAEYRGVGLTSGMQPPSMDGSIDVTVPVKAGTRWVGVTFQATNYRPNLNLVQEYDRKSLENNRIAQLQYPPAIGLLTISGPFNATRPVDSASIRKILTCRPADASQEGACAQEIISTLARRAFRRPVDATDKESLMLFYEEGRADGTFEDGIEMAIRRILASTQFLVRLEREPAALEADGAYRIDDLELASRLSFFLWSSIPDDELIDLAAEGRLSDPAVLEQQVRRMLQDPRSEALVENFGSQFLNLRSMAATYPDGRFYPNWDDELRNSFRRETELLFESLIREDRNVVDLLAADYTFINERLAIHYGIPNVYGSRFRRVALGPEMNYRRGLLGQGSFLSHTWVQNFRTSPVKRGVWILENILGTPAPSPPPNVPALEDSTAGTTRPLTLREQMSLHAKVEPCASCHKIMDPIGFALENFDADGSWRTTQGGKPIDTSVELWDGQVVNGPVELREAILRYTPQYVRTFTEKLMTYALGRTAKYFDMPVVRSIVREAENEDYRFSSIVMGIVKSPQFLMRTKEKEVSAASPR